VNGSDSKTTANTICISIGGWAALAAICLVALLLSGCSTLQSKWKWPGSEAKAKLPETVMPIWTDTVLHQPGQPGVRGFGGRVYFYADKNGDPIKVDGALTVYVFDGDAQDANSHKPLRKFVITADQLASHHSKSDLGDSYSIWLPWDKVGGPSQSLSLICRFDGREGGTAISDAASKLLPGETNDEVIVTKESKSAVQQVAFAEPAGDESDDELDNPAGESDSGARQGQLKSYSLALPPSFQRHITGTQPETTVIDAIAAKPATGAKSKSAASEGVATEATPLPQSESESDSELEKYPVRKTPLSQRVFAPRPSSRSRSEWRSGLAPTPRSPHGGSPPSPLQVDP
jgi:hypothetical protein